MFQHKVATTFRKLDFVIIFIAISFLPQITVSFRSRRLPAGSQCRNSEGTGICTPFPNCPPAIEEVRKNGFQPFHVCGFKGTTQIVCCPGTKLRSLDKNISNAFRKSESECMKYTDLPIVLTDQVIGGKNADRGEFPHMAALAFDDPIDKEFHFKCGGTLISNRYVLTAAHCVASHDTVNFVRLGEVFVPRVVSTLDPTKDYKVVNFTVHSNYTRLPNTNDIALLKLSEQVNFTSYIRPACLYTKKGVPKHLLVAGWGLTEPDGEPTEQLQKGIVHFFDHEKCESLYKTRRTINSNQICALGNNTDTCQGDSGGPLQTKSNARVATVVGVTSFGVYCGSKYPGIYTKLNEYLDWIEQIVWP